MMNLKIENRDAYHALAEALNQYVQNQEEYLDSNDDAEAETRTGEARKMVEKLDAVLIALAG